MRHIIVCCLIACCTFLATPHTASAQGSFGIGLIIGEPSGVSWIYHLSDRNALDGALGFSPFDRFRIHVDYLWMSRAFRDRQMSFSYGVGLAVGLGTRYRDDRRGIFGYTVQEGALAVRFPLALSYTFPRTPLELGVEIAPLLILGPAFGVSFDGGLFFRYYPG